MEIQPIGTVLTMPRIKGVEDVAEFIHAQITGGTVNAQDRMQYHF